MAACFAESRLLPGLAPHSLQTCEKDRVPRADRGRRRRRRQARAITRGWLLEQAPEGTEEGSGPFGFA